MLLQLFALLVQTLAKTTFDMVSAREQRQISAQSLEALPTHQPADLREGIANAYNVVSMVRSKREREKGGRVEAFGCCYKYI